MAELGGDALLEAFRDEVFEAFGLLMDFVPGIVENLMEEGFEEAVMADDLKGAPFSRLGELYSVVLLIDDERRFLQGELLQHVGDRRSGYVQVGRDLGA